MISASANAENKPYVGFDLNVTNAKNKFQDRVNYSSNSAHNSKADHDAIGFGLNAGYKVGFDQFFVAPELFFDYLNNSGKSASYDSDADIKRNASYEINYRYGAKVNLGYDFNDKFGAFVNLGLTNVDYDSNYENASYGASKIAMIYGLGASYNIDSNWTAKLAFDRQKFNTRDTFMGSRNINVIHTIRIGAAYSF